MMLTPQWLLEETLLALEWDTPQRVDALERRGSRPGTLLRYESWNVPMIGDLRYTGITGNIGVVSLLIFPRRHDHLPIFATEFVFFGESLRAGVVDLQAPEGVAHLPADVRAALLPLAEQWPGYLAREPLPDWCRTHFNPEAVFILRDDAPDHPALCRAYRDYLRAYVELARRPAENSPTDSPSVAHYKQHHIANTPGRLYLSRGFGEQWTEWFLAEKMYSLVASSEHNSLC
jgi:hypothetical protein